MKNTTTTATATAQKRSAVKQALRLEAEWMGWDMPHTLRSGDALFLCREYGVRPDHKWTGINAGAIGRFDVAFHIITNRD